VKKDQFFERALSMVRLKPFAVGAVLLTCLALVAGCAQIKVTLVGWDNATVGEPTENLVTISNPGDANATNVVVTDKLPDGLQYAGPSARVEVTGEHLDPPQVDGQILTWRIGALLPNQKSWYWFNAITKRVGTFENVVKATADKALPDRATYTTIVTPKH
jgi:uncharacterized repeat protein (TIGR01451 family)